MTGPLYVRQIWSLPGLAPWATVEEQHEARYGPLGPEWGTTPAGPGEGVFDEITDELNLVPEWRAWADRYDVAGVDATLVAESRSDRQTHVSRGRSSVRVDHRVPADAFDRDDVPPYEVFRQLVRDVWSAAAAELAWEQPPALPPWGKPAPCPALLGRADDGATQRADANGRVLGVRLGAGRCHH